MKHKYLQLHGLIKTKITKHKSLPFACLITRAMRESSVPLDNVASSPFPKNWKVGVTNFQSMKLVKTLERGWIYGPHATTLGLTVEREDAGHHDSRVVRAPSRSGARFSHASSSEVDPIREEVKRIGIKVDRMEQRMGFLEKTLSKMAKKMEQIWEKLGCKSTDDVAHSV